ncbi:MAG: aldehyde dehydrogenase [Flavobacteriia bacterium]|nr:MAG: aldehyde dehydrogenase [Flavobacteriia bacterium]
MQDTTQRDIQHIIDEQRRFFATHQTKDLKFRRTQLKKLKQMVLKHEKAIAEALYADLHKSYEEAYLTEISILLQEIDQHLKNLDRWAKPERVVSPVALMPSGSYIYKEPLGVSLIISPWNYPFQLLINPLVAAISTGCTAVLKPSPYVKNFEKLIVRLIGETFDPKYIAITHGGREVNQLLLAERWDFIFFTGSPYLGKIVMKAAAEHLTPVVLELGGKSPCIVDQSAHIKVAANRIVWGKLINAGQTCIAPDYLFVHQSVKAQLIEELKKAIAKQYGDDPKASPYFPRIISAANVERLKGLMKDGKIVAGGSVDEVERYIEPTLIDEVEPDFPIMQQEIFGPLLPIMTFESIDTVLDYVNAHEKPLAFYYFGNNKSAEDVLRRSTSGGGCINDTLMHIVNHHLPFGGVGNSGMGTYHGKESFNAFTNRRAIVKTPARIDLPLKYAPFKYFKMVKRML